ncbi:uncharacterized protein METZ01_LOCUS103117, partial [marine metagenome]
PVPDATSSNKEFSVTLHKSASSFVVSKAPGCKL